MASHHLLGSDEEQGVLLFTLAPARVQLQQGVSSSATWPLHSPEPCHLASSVLVSSVGQGTDAFSALTFVVCVSEKLSVRVNHSCA